MKDDKSIEVAQDCRGFDDLICLFTNNFLHNRTISYQGIGWKDEQSFRVSLRENPTYVSYKSNVLTLIKNSLYSDEFTLVKTGWNDGTFSKIFDDTAIVKKRFVTYDSARNNMRPSSTLPLLLGHALEAYYNPKYVELLDWNAFKAKFGPVFEMVGEPL
jgi:hypothetical protein